MTKRPWWSVHRRGDGALSDIVGTTILLGVTVVLVGAATITFTNGSRVRTPAPPLELRANAVPGEPGVVTVTHTGGATYAPGDLDLVVSGATWSERHTLNESSDWSLGRSFSLPLSRNLSGGERLDVLLVSRAVGGTVAAAAVDVVPATMPTLPAGAFTLSMHEPAAGASVSVPAGATLAVMVDVAHAYGRKAIVSVAADLSPVGGSPVSPLHDDGTRGDDTGGDLRYTAYLVIPPEATPSAAPIPISLEATDVNGLTASAAAAFSIVVTPSAQALVTNLTNVTNVILSNVSNISTTLNDPTVLSFFETLQNGTNISQFFNTSGLDNETLELLQNLTNLTQQSNLTNLSWLNSSTLEFLSNLTNLTYGNFTNLTQTLISYANATPLGPPELASVAPPNGTVTTLVTLTGKNFTYTNTVVFLNGSDAYGATWWIESDSTITLLPPLTAPLGSYDVSVSNPAGTAILADAFLLEAPNPSAPMDLTMSPLTGFVGDTISVDGLNLDTVRHVTLNNGTLSLDVEWWMDGGELKFLIPSTAAPGLSSKDFVVRLAGTAGSPANVPTPLTVLPTPGPLITAFTPKAGVPFTQVNVIGQNFVDVQSVTFNGTNAYFAVVSPTQLLVVTHASIQPGWYSIKVTTSTGSNSTSEKYLGLFQALKAPIIPVYSPTVFEYVATWATKNASSGGPGDEFDVWTKFKLVSNVSIAGQHNLKLVNQTNCNANAGGSCDFFTYVPFKPGNQVPQGFGTAVCGSGSGPWVFHWKGQLQNYVSSTFAMQFYLTFSFSPTGNANNIQTATVTTTDANQYYSLTPTDPYIAVYDHGQPSNSNFTTCQ